MHRGANHGTRTGQLILGTCDPYELVAPGQGPRPPLSMRQSSRHRPAVGLLALASIRAPWQAEAVSQQSLIYFGKSQTQTREINAIYFVRQGDVLRIKFGVLLERRAVPGRAWPCRALHRQ